MNQRNGRRRNPQNHGHGSSFLVPNAVFPQLSSLRSHQWRQCFCPLFLPNLVRRDLLGDVAPIGAVFPQACAWHHVQHGVMPAIVQNCFPIFLANLPSTSAIPWLISSRKMARNAGMVAALCCAHFHLSHRLVDLQSLRHHFCKLHFCTCLAFTIWCAIRSGVFCRMILISMPINESEETLFEVGTHILPVCSILTCFPNCHSTFTFFKAFPCPVCHLVECFNSCKPGFNSKDPAPLLAHTCTFCRTLRRAHYWSPCFCTESSANRLWRVWRQFFWERLWRQCELQNGMMGGVVFPIFWVRFGAPKVPKTKKKGNRKKNSRKLIKNRENRKNMENI